MYLYVCVQLVELKNGDTYNGHLVNCDTWMNVNLRDVICTSKVRANGRKERVRPLHTPIHSYSYSPTLYASRTATASGRCPSVISVATRSSTSGSRTTYGNTHSLGGPVCEWRTGCVYDLMYVGVDFYCTRFWTWCRKTISRSGTDHRIAAVDAVAAAASEAAAGEATALVVVVVDEAATVDEEEEEVTLAAEATDRADEEATDRADEEATEVAEKVRVAAGAEEGEPAVRQAVVEAVGVASSVLCPHVVIGVTTIRNQMLIKRRMTEMMTHSFGDCDSLARVLIARASVSFRSLSLSLARFLPALPLLLSLVVRLTYCVLVCGYRAEICSLAFRSLAY